MILDRDLQLEMLNKMASVYPFPYDFGDELKRLPTQDDLGELLPHRWVPPQ